MSGNSGIDILVHPRMVLFPDDQDLKLLNTIDEKISIEKQVYNI